MMMVGSRMSHFSIVMAPVRMMLVYSLTILVGISLVQAVAHDNRKRILRSADNVDKLDNADDLKEDLIAKTQSVVIDENGDEIVDQTAIDELNRLDAAVSNLERPASIPDEMPAQTDDVIGDSSPERRRRRKRAAFPTTVRLWDKGVVVYVFHPSTTDEIKANLLTVMRYIEQATCIRYVEYYPGVFQAYELPHENVIQIYDSGWCYSPIGRGSVKYETEGKVQVLRPCAIHHTTAMHEFFHSLGSWHENQRSDRSTIYHIFSNNAAAEKWSDVEKIEDTNNTYPYSLDSIMQYSTSTGSLNGNKTMITYDQDLAYIEKATDDYMTYNDIRIVNSVYQCAELKCANHPYQCKNDGYLAYVNNKECRCVCPQGLGGNTCEEKFTPAPISSWPAGSYCLPADKSGCSESSMKTGYRKEHFKRLGLQKFRALFPREASDDNKVLTHKFCCSENGVDVWPNGTYCLFMYKNNCPQGFKKGTMLFDDKNEGNLNEVGGDAYPSGSYGENTEFNYCCRDDGAPQVPVVMQNTKPFNMLPGRYNHACQRVAGMLDQRMEYIFQTETTQDKFTQPHPHANLQYWDQHYKMVYCHYTPRTYDCGGVEILNDNRRSVTIRSPNYPNAYSSNTVCSWTFTSPEKTLLKVEFKHFNITVYSDGDCTYDFLEIRHWNPETPGRTFCGVQFPRGIVSYKNQMLLELQTSDLTPATGFEATVSLVDASALKYRRSDAYMGKVSYTQKYQKCLRWDEVMNCSHNVYIGDPTGVLGPHNHCRNPAKQFTRPWCYVDATTCYSDVCDVGGVVDCYDKSELCTSLMSDASYCQSDAGFEYCHKSCGFCDQDVEDPKACGAAPEMPDSLSMTSQAKDSYVNGDIITYKEKDTEVTEERMCLTNGKWTGPACNYTPCPMGWTEALPGRCYKFFDEKIDFYSVPQACAKYGARSAFAATAEEQKAIEAVLPDPKIDGHKTYIGMKKQFDNDGGVYQWLDGRNLTYTNWRDDNSRSRHCVTQVSTGGKYVWADIPWCNFYEHYVCERFTTCQKGYYASGDGVCYKYYSKDQKSRADAKAVCESDGGQLAVGSTEQEHLAIMAILPYHPPENNFVYFGLKRSAPGASTFVWGNGNSVSFTKWAPARFLSDGDCGGLRWIRQQRAYMWDHKACDAASTFVCQKPIDFTYECSDGTRDCSIFAADSSLCRHVDYRDYAYNNCPKTCGFCS